MTLGGDPPCVHLVIPDSAWNLLGIFVGLLGLEDQGSAIESNPHGERHSNLRAGSSSGDLIGALLRDLR